MAKRPQPKDRIAREIDIAKTEIIQAVTSSDRFPKQLQSLVANVVHSEMKVLEDRIWQLEVAYSAGVCSKG